MFDWVLNTPLFLYIKVVLLKFRAAEGSREGVQRGQFSTIFQKLLKSVLFPPKIC